jgi:glycosyl-4,4'-diaponeurosporenoate acyltransferase
MLPVVEMTTGWTVLVDSVVWAVLSVSIGYVAHRTAPHRFAHDTWITRLRPVEHDGRWYEQRWRIQRWKHRLPEGGAAFRGGVDKRHLLGRDDATLERFVVETRRAELTHWALMACGPLFALWNPPALAAVMVVFGVVANLPCLVTQRYNRARLRRVLTRRAERAVTTRGAA